MSLASQSWRQWPLVMAWVLVVVLLMLPNIAQAQPVDAQRAIDAQALFEQAINEMDAGQYLGACRKLEEVTRLVPDGVGGKYALGECYERLGRLASAWTQFSFAQQVATRLGQTERAADAGSKANSIKPKLATLSVNVAALLKTVPGIVVLRDGVELREPQWGTALYVDAGQHEVVVSAPGYTTWKKRVEVLTDGVTVKFSIPENAIKPEAKDESQMGTGAMPILLAPGTPDRGWQKPLGRAITGAGVIGIAAGAILGVVAISKNDESNQRGHCDSTTNRCDDLGIALRSQAVGLGNAATGLLIAGAATGVGGVILWATAPKENAPATEKRAPQKENKVQATIELGPGWLGVNGTF